MIRPDRDKGAVCSADFGVVWADEEIIHFVQISQPLVLIFNRYYFKLVMRAAVADSVPQIHKNVAWVENGSPDTDCFGGGEMRCLYFLNCMFREIYDFLRLRIQALACCCQNNSMVGTPEQFYTQMGFKAVDLFDHGGMGNVELVCRFCKAAGIGYCLKGI